MSDVAQRAVVDLASVLEEENAALNVLDLTRAASLLVRKTTAIGALEALEGTSFDPAVIREAKRLDGLIRENRRLLERALAAQQRVIGIVVRATASVEPSYGIPGQTPRLSRPMTLSTRA